MSNPHEDALTSNPFVDPARAPMNYSIGGTGFCMTPLIPVGATYSMSQTEAVAVGDLVAVFFAEGVCTFGGNFRCKVLTGQTPETITLMQFNPLQSLTFKRDRILAMHRVVAVHLPLQRTPIDPRALLAPYLRPSWNPANLRSYKDHLPMLMNMTTFDASLHCGFDGVDGATTATDDSNSAHTLTFNGNAQIDTAQSKFGGASLLLDGSGDYVTSADSADWNFTGEFTIEAWVRTGAPTQNLTSIGQQLTTGNQRSWSMEIFSSQIRFIYSTAGSDATVVEPTGDTVSANTWYHHAVDRDASGNLRLYVDGVMVHKATGVSSALFNSTAALAIGARSNGTVPWNGHIDEVRVTKGVARYASDSGFTVPTAAYPRS